MGHGQQPIDSRAQVKHGFKLFLALKQLFRWLPDNGVIGIHRRAVGVPYVNLGFRKQLLYGNGPALRFGVSCYK